nr:S-layer protein [Methanocaldococcus vulcanius]
MLSSFEVPQGGKQFVAITYENGTFVPKTINDLINVSEIVGIGVVYDSYKIYNAVGDEIEKIKVTNEAALPENGKIVFISASDSDYADSLAKEAEDAFSGDHLSDIISGTDVRVKSLGVLPTALKIDDIDPDDWYTETKDDDAGEIFVVSVKNDSDDGITIKKREALYMSLAYKDGDSNIEDTVPIKPGDRIPFLGKEEAVVKIDSDKDAIYLGDPVYEGVMKEGSEIDVGNGYSVKVKQVLKSTNPGEYKVTVDIIKDGTVVAEKSDTVDTSTGQTMKFVYGGIGVVVHTAWMNIGETQGYAELLITKNTKEIDLGKKYIGDYKAYAVVRNPFSDVLNLESDIKDSDNIVGIALRYEGDDLTSLEDGDSLNIADYVSFKFDDENKQDRLYVYFSMDKEEPLELQTGETASILNAKITLNNIEGTAVEPCSLTAPIAKLDSEVSLDTADKNLVLVGGPVANKLTKELVEEGKLELNNTSPPTIALIPGVANGHDVIVVAGGDREKTREAALELIKNL